jgi:hypothetical protein
MACTITDREKVIELREVASIVEFGFWQAGTVAINGFQCRRVTVRKLIGTNTDDRPIFLVCFLDNMGFAKLGGIDEVPAG